MLLEILQKPEISVGLSSEIVGWLETSGLSFRHFQRLTDLEVKVFELFLFERWQICIGFVWPYLFIHDIHHKCRCQFFCPATSNALPTKFQPQRPNASSYTDFRPDLTRHRKKHQETHQWPTHSGFYSRLFAHLYKYQIFLLCSQYSATYGLPIAFVNKNSFMPTTKPCPEVMRINSEGPTQACSGARSWQSETHLVSRCLEIGWEVEGRNSRKGWEFQGGRFSEIWWKNALLNNFISIFGPLPFCDLVFFGYKPKRIDEFCASKFAALRLHRMFLKLTL